MYYPNELVEEIREKNDIVDVISSYVSLKKTGSNYVGLCPFHREKTGSFSVSQTKQIYHCFGCGVGGNVYTFLMEYENITFPEAVQMLAERAGIQLSGETLTEEDKRRYRDKEVIYDIHREAAVYFVKRLMSDRGKDAFKYLTDRGIDVEVIKHFGLGYSDKYSDDLYKYLKSKGYNDDILKRTGLIKFDEKRGAYDKFNNRVMYPIMNKMGKVVAFGGRVMGDAKPKYLNSPDTEIFDKSQNLYGISLIKGNLGDGIILCEGYMDVIALHKVGITNAVATLGTALTEKQCDIISRMLKNNKNLVYLCYDSDGAGVKAAQRAIPMLNAVGLQVKIINLRPYKDPDEFINGLNKDEFMKRVEEAESSFFFSVSLLEQTFNINDPEEKTQFMNKVADRCTEFENEIERTNYIEAFCRRYGVRVDDFKKLVGIRASVKVGKDYEKIKREKARRQDDKKENLASSAEAYLLTWLSSDISLFEVIDGIVGPEDFTNQPFTDVAKMLFEQAEEGKIIPAKIISCYDNVEEQSLVARIFDSELRQVESDSERERAFNELVKKIKKESLDQRLKTNTDLGLLPELMKEMNKIDSLNIRLKERKV
ncbi:DNA primase [Eubacterium xylanophilum]|uniref:DNA primase n=1 Tax=Eubacterium xylanophilum TaxID=39497 RepID=UPI000479E60C|nr:DNA primase [Eubacterium xylanophilum]